MNRTGIGLAFLAYCLCWGAYCLLPEIRWDDWILFSLTPDQLLEEPDPRMPVYAAFCLFPHPEWIYPIATFLTMALAGWVLVTLLPSFISLTPFQLWYSLALFWILPLNAARIAAINFPYLLSLLLFLLGLKVFISNSGLLARIGAASLWMASFMTPSLLVFFYAIALIYIVRFSGQLRKPDALFLLLPGLAWWIRGKWFRPQGPYADYYALTPDGMLKAPLRSVLVLGRNVVEGLELIPQALLFILVAGVLVFLGRMILKKYFPKPQPTCRPPRLHAGGAGVFLLMAAVFPYVAIGKEPGFNDWLSRHQLLLAPGIILVFLEVDNRLSSRIQYLLRGCILSISLGICLFFQWEWFQDGRRVAEIRQALIRAAVPDSVHTVRVLLGDAAGLARNRSLRFYELGGYFHRQGLYPGKAFFPDPPGWVEEIGALRTDRYFLESWTPETGDTVEIAAGRR